MEEPSWLRESFFANDASLDGYQANNYQRQRLLIQNHKVAPAPASARGYHKHRYLFSKRHHWQPNITSFHPSNPGMLPLVCAYPVASACPQRHQHSIQPHPTIHATPYVSLWSVFRIAKHDNMNGYMIGEANQPGPSSTSPKTQSNNHNNHNARFVIEIANVTNLKTNLSIILERPFIPA